MRKSGTVRRVMFGAAFVAMAAMSDAKEMPATPDAPATVEPIEGSELSRVLLTEAATTRLGIETVPIREEAMEKSWVLRGEVVLVDAKPMSATEADMLPTNLGNSGPLMETATADQLEIRVPYYRDLNSLGAELLSRVLIEVDDDDEHNADSSEVVAELVDDDDDSDPREDPEWLSYVLTSDEAAKQLKPGQEVLVRVPVVAFSRPPRVVPYSAVFYDARGGTWVYTNPQPLTFIRAPVTLDFVSGDLAVLADGPDVGTHVVTVGVAELWGTEFGVGH